jgi:hypothetical protein
MWGTNANARLRAAHPGATNENAYRQRAQDRRKYSEKPRPSGIAGKPGADDLGAGPEASGVLVDLDDDFVAVDPDDFAQQCRGPDTHGLPHRERAVGHARSTGPLISGSSLGSRRSPHRAFR